MKELILKQITKEEAEVLQYELGQYAEIVKLGFNYISNDEFLNALLITDVALQLWLSFNKKLSSYKSSHNVKLKISEAIVLFKCCYWERSGRSVFQVNVAEKYKGLIDQQLKSLNIVIT